MSIGVANAEGAGDDVPLLDPAPIRKLAEDLSPCVALRFLEDYFTMLPGRWKRIRTTLDGEDPDGALDALRSLRITSVMTGTLGTAASCSLMEALVHAGRFMEARAEVRKLGVALDILSGAAHHLMQWAQDDLVSSSFSYSRECRSP